jgi:NADPH2 dehydrogenase
MYTAKDDGIDIINVSSGGVAPARIKTYQGYQIKFAEIIKEKTNFSVIAGGLIVKSINKWFCYLCR